MCNWFQSKRYKNDNHKAYIKADQNIHHKLNKENLYAKWFDRSQLLFRACVILDLHKKSSGKAVCPYKPIYNHGEDS